MVLPQGRLITVATEDQPSPPSIVRPVSGWEQLPTAEQARQWEQVDPKFFDRIMAGIENAERHQRRLDWAELGLRAFGMLSGSGAIAVLALVARHMADHGDATQGVGVFGAGIAATASVIIAYTRTRKDDKH